MNRFFHHMFLDLINKDDVQRLVSEHIDEGTSKGWTLEHMTESLVAPVTEPLMHQVTWRLHYSFVWTKDD